MSPAPAGGGGGGGDGGGGGLTGGLGDSETLLSGAGVRDDTERQRARERESPKNSKQGHGKVSPLETGVFGRIVSPLMSVD